MIADMTTQLWWVARWPDGSVTRGSDAQAVLDRIAASPWNEGEPVKDLLARRAAQMWGVKLDPTLPADLFLTAMADARIITLDRITGGGSR